MGQRQQTHSKADMSALEAWEARVDRITGRPPLFSDN